MASLSSLEPALSNFPEYKQAVIVAQIMQNYLQLAIDELNRFTGEITLQDMLRNNSDLIDLVKVSFDSAPWLLEVLMTQPMKVNQVRLHDYSTC